MTTTRRTSKACIVDSGRQQGDRRPRLVNDQTAETAMRDTRHRREPQLNRRGRQDRILCVQLARARAKVRITAIVVVVVVVVETPRHAMRPGKNPFPRVRLLWLTESSDIQHIPDKFSEKYNRYFTVNNFIRE